MARVGKRYAGEVAAAKRSHPGLDLMTSGEVAKKFDVDVRTVQRWAASGRLPYVQKLSGQRGSYLFDRATMEELQ